MIDNGVTCKHAIDQDQETPRVSKVNPTTPSLPTHHNRQELQNQR